MTHHVLLLPKKLSTVDHCPVLHDIYKRLQLYPLESPQDWEKYHAHTHGTYAQNLFIQIDLYTLKFTFSLKPC